MGQRKTTADVLNDLTKTGGDIAAEKARNDLLATIPDPVFRSDIVRAMVKMSRELNVRDKESYEFGENKELYRSLDEFGLQKRNPMMSFSQRPDGSLMTIGGNLRNTVMDMIVQNATDRGEVDHRFDVIHGLVWTGLTAEQESALVTDQTLQKGLNEFELAKAIGVKAELNPGMSDAKIGISFGMDKNKIRRYRMRYSMPSVFAEYRKQKSGKPGESYVEVGQKQLEALYSAYLADRAAGNGFRDEGPQFRLAWQTVRDDPDAYKTPTAKEDKPVGPGADVIGKQVAASAAAFGETPEIIAIDHALLWAIGRPINDQPANLNAIRQTVKDYCDGLRSQVEKLALDVESARNSESSLLEAAEGLEKDLQDTRAELATVKAGNNGHTVASV